MIPCSININDYFIFFHGNVNVNLVVFIENFLGNEGVDMVSPLMILFIIHNHIIKIIFRYNGIFYDFP
jgi:hypothetical protein